MPAHNSQGKNNHPAKKQIQDPVMIKAPAINQKKEQVAQMEKEVVSLPKNFSSTERSKFYAGHDRLDLQGNSVQRVRELHEENDHLQREISSKETDIVECSDPLSILADIEHRKIIIARNTGEILKIYLKNEERLKRIKDLEAKNQRIQKEMMDIQGRFITTKDLEEKTTIASEFFILKSEMEQNLEEIQELNKN